MYNFQISTMSHGCHPTHSTSTDQSLLKDPEMNLDDELDIPNIRAPVESGYNVFLCGFVGKRLHNQLLYAISQDIMPTYSVKNKLLRLKSEAQFWHIHNFETLNPEN